MFAEADAEACEEPVHVLRFADRPILGGARRKHVVEGVADLGGQVEPVPKSEMVAKTKLEAATQRIQVVRRRARREQGVRVAVDTQVKGAPVVCASLSRREHQRSASASRGQRDCKEGAASLRAGENHGGRPPKGLDVLRGALNQSTSSQQTMSGAAPSRTSFNCADAT
jgi:hypothetical protein